LLMEDGARFTGKIDMAAPAPVQILPDVNEEPGKLTG